MGVLESCVTYPYTDVAAFVPIEYIWMYPALLMALLFVVLVVCIHHTADADKKIFSQIALAFAVISATAHTITTLFNSQSCSPVSSRANLRVSRCTRNTIRTGSLSLWKMPAI
jgi:uncharacterized membrane protein